MHLALGSEMKKVSAEGAALPLFVGKHQPCRKHDNRTATFACMWRLQVRSDGLVASYGTWEMLAWVLPVLGLCCSRGLCCVCTCCTDPLFHGVGKELCLHLSFFERRTKRPDPSLCWANTSRDPRFPRTVHHNAADSCCEQESKLMIAVIPTMLMICRKMN